MQAEYGSVDKGESAIAIRPPFVAEREEVVAAPSERVEKALAVEEASVDAAQFNKGSNSLKIAEIHQI